MKRYSRQTILSWFGREGQDRLLSSKILIAGCGALGSITIERLARAGVGFIRVVDRDIVEIENLQRQTLFTEEDAIKVRPKAEAAVRHIREINSEIEVEGIVADLNPSTILPLLEDIDIVIDGTDSIETRLLINDACIKSGIPWIYGACISTIGMTMNIHPSQGACFRCFIDSPPPPGTLPTCDTVGILNTVPSIVSAIQVSEAIKILLSREAKFAELRTFDLYTGEDIKISIRRKRSCPTCVYKRFDFLVDDSFSKAVTLCGRNAVQLLPEGRAEISLEDLKKELEGSGDGEISFFGDLLRFRKGDIEMVIFKDGRAIVKGTSDIGRAKGFYSRYMG